jgi:hypothetical protein
VAAASIAGCGDDDGGASSVCGPDRRETLDPASATHVLPGAGEPEYLTDPPTSGPHTAVQVFSGVLDEPLSRSDQVGGLELGGVLLQHRDLAPDELAELEAVAGESVAVAPNPDLPDRVVATAWLFKQTCSGVDAGALRAFAEAHVGEGPGSDG